MRLLKILVLTLFFISILCQSLLAQNIRKVAYINAAKVIDSYNKTKEADEKLRKEAEKKDKEREKMVDEINKLRDEVELLSKEAREKKELELSEKMRKLQDFDGETRTNLQRTRNDMMREILKEIDEAIKEYGNKQGYDIIFDGRVLLYANESIDVTDELIGILNKGK